MNKLKSNKNLSLLQKVEFLLDENKMTLKSLAKKMDYKESYLVDSLNREVWPAVAYSKFIKELAEALSVNIAELGKNNKAKPSEENNELESNNLDKSIIQESIEEKVRMLIRKKGITFVELAKRIGYSNAGLHRSFSNNSITLTTLELIAGALDVDVSFFFENIVIEKLIDEIMIHNKTVDMKIFMFGLSRDISKGLSLKDAVYKNIDPEGYKFSLYA